MVLTCRKRPVALEALQWTGYNKYEIKDFMGDDARFIQYEPGDFPALYINSIYNTNTCVQLHDYIIKDENGRYCPCAYEYFKEKYEVME